MSTLARRFGARSAVRARVISFLRRAGATHVAADRTGLDVSATLSVARAQRLFGTRLSSFRTDTKSGVARFVAPESATHVPGALAGDVTGVVGLDTQPLATTPAPRRKRWAAPPTARRCTRCAPPIARHPPRQRLSAPDGHAVRLRRRSPEGGRLHPESVSDRLRDVAAAVRGLHRRRRAGGAAGDRRFQVVRRHAIRQVLQAADAAREAVRRRDLARRWRPAARRRSTWRS